jgi:hypothetical protein
MSCSLSFLARLTGGVCLAAAVSGCAAGWRSPQPLGRCYQLYALWQRYETEHCPNTTGQRAQADWGLYQCQIGNFDNGFRELARLLHRDLIPVPGSLRPSDRARFPGRERE